MRLMLLAPVMMLTIAVLPSPRARAQANAISRTLLQSAEAPETAHSVQSYLVTVAPHATVARHTHPGVEVGYILAGALTVSVTGQPDRVIKPGDSWSFPAGVPHMLVNDDDGPAQLVVTYVVEKAKPLSTPAP